MPDEQKAQKDYPKSFTLMVADDIRKEENGKLTIIGFYAHGIQLSREEFDKANTDGKPLALTQLSLMALFRDGKGSFIPSCKITDAEGTEIANYTAPEPRPKDSEDKPLVITFKLAPMPLPTLGKYQVLLKLDDTEYPAELPITAV